MPVASKTPLIWPLLDKLRPMTAYQRQPRSAPPFGLMRLPIIPWDEADRPGVPTYGVVESDPKLWDFAPWKFGLAAIRVQAARLQDFQTNPRALRISVQAREPAAVHPAKLPARIASISGITKDSTGAVLGGCTVELYEAATNLPLMQTVSDASTGAYLFTCARYSPATHYVVAYKAGSPDVAGTTVNTLTGTG